MTLPMPPELLLARAMAFDEAAEILLAAAYRAHTARTAAVLYVQVEALRQRAREERELLAQEMMPEVET